MSVSRNSWLVAGVFLVSLSVLYVRFSYWLPYVWYADDLRDFYASVDGDFVHSWQTAFTTTFASKWRPIFSLFMWIEYSNFREIIEYYYIVNFLIGALSICIFFFLSHMLSGSMLVASGLSALMAWSRFSTYQMTQVNGPVEALPLLFTLVATFCVSLAELGERLTDNDARRRSFLIVAAIISMGIAAYAHERYLVGLVVLALYVWLAGDLITKNRLHNTIFIFFIIAFNVVAKVAIFRINFFTGTGGQGIGFDPGLIIQHIFEALSSAVWFNYGPEYLVGAHTTSLPTFFVFLAFISLCSIACIAILGVSGAVIDRANWLLPLFILFLSGTLLIPGVVLFRFEQRWLFTTFVLGLLLLSWCARYIFSKKLQAVLLVSLVCSAMVVENRLAFAAERYFFLTRSMRIAQDARQLLNGKSNALVLEGVEASVCSWVLSRGLFFRMYQGVKRDLYCVNTQETYPSTPPDDAERFTHSLGGFQVKAP